MNRNRSRGAPLLSAAALGLAIGACGGNDASSTTGTSANGTDRASRRP
jgi:hypothetical protein